MSNSVKEYLIRKQFYGYQHGDVTGEMFEDTLLGSWDEEEDSWVSPDTDQNVSVYGREHVSFDISVDTV